MAEPIFNRLCLIGLGLIGSSLARLARERGDIARTLVACDHGVGVAHRLREYRAAVQRQAGTAGTFGLEGYISARLVVEGLRGAGREPTRAAFVQALANPALTHVGGFPVRYRSEPREGSPYVDLAIIGSGGKLVQ